MASSVARRMPAVDVGPFGSPASLNLKKIITRDQQPRHHLRPRWADHQAHGPVSARAGGWESAPSMSGGSSAASEIVDLMDNGRAASLIQMWREMEADGATPRAGEKEGSLVRVRSLRFRRETEEMLERMQKERETEVAAVAQMRRVSGFSHRGRIQAMLKFRFVGKDLSIQYRAAPALRKRAPELSRSNDTILCIREKFDNQNQNDSDIQDAGRSSIVDVQIPVDSHDTCSFHPSDLHSTDNNQYLEVISIEGSESMPPESTSPRSRSEDLEDGCHDADVSSLHSRIEELIEASQCRAFDPLDSINNELHKRPQCPEPNSLDSDREYPQEGCQSPGLSLVHFRSKDLNDGSHDLAASWDERNLLASNLDWPTMESQNVHCWQSEREVISEEVESYRQQDIVRSGYACMGDSYISWRSCEDDQDYFESFSDNVEIRELLKRRRVRTSLESDFCHKMNQMIMKLLQMQGEQYTNENISEYWEQPTLIHNYEFNDADRAVSDSSLVCSSYQRVHYPDSWQHTPCTPHSSNSLPELESGHGLKNEMVQMHQEITDLKKLVESCMKWQAKLHDSIKDEVSSAIRQSVSAATPSEDSKMPSGQKVSCCVCHEMPVDSLLYRCGHMCACFKCAQELQWSSGRCPICRTPIIDVVRAYLNT